MILRLSQPINQMMMKILLIFSFYPILQILAGQDQTQHVNNQIADDSLAYRVNLNVLREGQTPLRYTDQLTNPTSPTFLRVADKAEKGMNAVFCRDTSTCNPLYIGCQVSGITPTVSGDRNVQIIFTLYWKPTYQNGVMGLTKDLYNSLASNNGFLGNSDLFVGPIESISKSYTYAMPIMKVNGRDVTYNNEYENTKSRAYYLVVVEFENSMDSIFRNSGTFSDSYLACTVDDIDPLPILQKGIMVTYTIYLLQNYTRGPDHVSNFVKQGFANSPNGCLPQAQLCTLPTNNGIELQMNVVRKGFSKLAYRPQYRDRKSRDYTEMKDLFENGMKQVINASPLSQNYVNCEFMEISDTQPFHLGLLFKYRITVKPQYGGDEQRVASDIAKTIGQWGRNCLGSTGLCVDKVPGECSMGHPETCDRNQVCTVDPDLKRTSCRCAPNYVKTSALGPCFPSTCNGRCGPSQTCAYNSKRARMECDCQAGYRRFKPLGPCVVATCDVGTNAGCFGGQECVYVTQPAPAIACRCRRGYAPLGGAGADGSPNNGAGLCVPRACDPGSGTGCPAPGQTCGRSVHGRPACQCAPGYYGVNQRHHGNSNKGLSCVNGPCNPTTNQGCNGPYEVCSVGGGKIYCACTHGYIRTNADSPCVRNLCDPRTSSGCSQSEQCLYNNGQYECSCRRGFFKGKGGGGNDNNCAPEPCDPRANTGCPGPNEYCLSDQAGTRCACKNGFDRPRGSQTCIRAQCRDEGNDCGENQECALTKDGNSLECRCLSGFYYASSQIGPGGRCVRADCDLATHQGCRQNEKCLLSPTTQLPTCQCPSQFYRIGDQCIQGTCNPVDNSGCNGQNEVCRVDNGEASQAPWSNQNSGPYCACARGFVKFRSNEGCVPAECDPTQNSKDNRVGNGGCQFNEQCTLVRNAYKCQCKPGHVRIRENGICYPASCEPATNEGCPKPEICALVNDNIKCICPYNYRKAGLDQRCIYAPCDPVTNEGCPVNEICKIFPTEIKCVCSRGYLRNSDEQCIKEYTNDSAEIVTKCRPGDQQLINCGPNSECILINGVPICRCLPGFLKDDNGRCVGKDGIPQVTATTYVSTGITITVHPEPTTEEQFTFPTNVPPIIIIPPVVTHNVTCDDIHCGPNQICVVNPGGTAECQCNYGFDRAPNGSCFDSSTSGGTFAPIWGGNITCDDEFCNYKGHCRINQDTGIRYCECERWWIGKQCQHNGKLIAILAPLLLGLLLLLCCLFPLCWCFGRKRKKRMAENIRIGEDKWDQGKLAPYTIPRPMVSPVARIDEQALIRDGSLKGFPETSIDDNSFDKRAQRERAVIARDEKLFHARPEETTEITEETTTEEWKRTYKKPHGKKRLYIPAHTERYLEEAPRYEGRRSTTPIRRSRKTRTEDVEEEESAEYTTESRNVETDNENDVYVGKRQWIRGNGASGYTHEQGAEASQSQRQQQQQQQPQDRPKTSNQNYQYEQQRPWVREKRGTENYAYRNEEAN